MSVLQKKGPYKPYRPREFATPQKEITEKETDIIDERFAFDVTTVAYIRRFRLSPAVQPVLSIPVTYNPERKVFEIGAGASLVDARIQARFHGEALPTLIDVGYYPLSLDRKARLLVNTLENDYSIVTLDLTVERTDVALGVSGTSLTIIRKGGAPWSFKFNSATKDAILSDWINDGTTFEIEFTDIYVTNSAAAAGTPPVVLFIGRRV